MEERVAALEQKVAALEVEAQERRDMDAFALWVQRHGELAEAERLAVSKDTATLHRLISKTYGELCVLKQQMASLNTE